MEDLIALSTIDLIEIYGTLQETTTDEALFSNGQRIFTKAYHILVCNANLNKFAIIHIIRVCTMTTNELNQTDNRKICRKLEIFGK